MSTKQLTSQRANECTVSLSFSVGSTLAHHVRFQNTEMEPEKYFS